MKYLVALQVGDYSGDGHGCSDSFTFHSTFSSSELLEILRYPKGARLKEVFGFYPGDLAAEYEDHYYSAEQVAALKPILCKLLGVSEEELGKMTRPFNGRLDLWELGNATELHVKVVLEMIAQAFPDFSYQLQTPSVVWANCGGYGLLGL